MDFTPSKEREIVIDIEGFVDTFTEEVGTPSPADENSGNVVSITVSGDENSSNPKAVDEISRKKGKSTSKKKASKPPRPPRGLSLDAFDQKLIKEISELAMIKRAKIERMKALKKMKASSSSTSSSSSGNVMAILFTVIFCLVIVLQGCHSSGTSKPAVLTRGSLESSTVPLTSIGSPKVIMQPVLGPDIARAEAEKSVHGD